MSGQNRYSDEAKIDAVAQVTERGYSVKDVAELPDRQAETFDIEDGRESAINLQLAQAFSEPS